MQSISPSPLYRSGLFLTLLVLLQHAAAVLAQDEGELALTVSPPYAWFTELTPYGTIQITNTGSRTSEVIIEVEYGIGLPSAEGGPAISEDLPAPRDLSPHLVVFPPRMILEPGAIQVVRYSVREATSLPPAGYVATLRCRLTPRVPVRSGQVPASAAGVQIQYVMAIPLMLIHGDGAPRIHAELVSRDAGKAVLRFENGSGRPWGGMVRLTSVDGMQMHGEGMLTLFTERDLEIPLQVPLDPRFQIIFDEEVPWLPPLIQSRLGTPPALLITQ